MILTIAGAPGSGKSTVGKILAEKLGYKFYSMGDIWGEAAKEAGMTLNEFFEAGKRDPTFNNKLDDFQTKLGEQDNLVIDSRLGFHFIPHAVKIYLTVDEDVSAHRIFSTLRDDEKYTSLAEARKAIHARKKKETELYSHLYSVDVHDTKNFDYVIDSTHHTQQEIAEKILMRLQQ